jgi:Mn-dependent DtxR family transcriptional regulator
VSIVEDIIKKAKCDLLDSEIETLTPVKKQIIKTISELQSEKGEYVSVTDLATKLGKAKGGISVHLRDLEEEGLVVQDPDTRKFYLSFTPK